MAFHKILKYNPNHDPKNGQFTTAGGAHGAAAGTQEGSLRQRSGVSGSPEQLAASGGPDSGQGPLRGLPRKANVPGVGEIEVGPLAVARKAAEDYMREAGLPYDPPRDYVPADPERGARIAKAFDEMRHDPQNPEVRDAYAAMIRETEAQYDAILRTGLKVEFIDYEKQGDPYAASPRLAGLDVAKNNHLYVFSTRDGFGSDDTFDPRDNPLLGSTKYADVHGKPMLANDVFRVVHDYFGHFKEGVGFRASGEENVWRSHSAMYSPKARRAMTSETRGQNSWVNFGPHGAKNRSASSAETVFADQKVGLLPGWVVTEGARDAGYGSALRRP